MSERKYGLPHDELVRILLKHGYIYCRPIGQGGFSSVHQIKSKKYGRDFCVKESLDETNDQTVDLQNAEISTLMDLDHPNIISMYDYFRESRHLFIVLEFCKNGSLEDKISKEGPLRPPLLFNYWRQILIALQFCHDHNIAHRDIKPGNVLIDQYERPKLADFGLSAYYHSGEKISNFAGSRAFMSPEIIQRTAYDLFSADIWALGVMFYEMAFGKVPWQTNDRKALEQSILLASVHFPQDADPNVVSIIQKMIIKNPKSRATCQTLLEYPSIKGAIHSGTCSSAISQAGREMTGIRLSSLNLPMNTSKLNLMAVQINKETTDTNFPTIQQHYSEGKISVPQTTAGTMSFNNLRPIPGRKMSSNIKNIFTAMPTFQE